jgi:hypothetical protein
MTKLPNKEGPVKRVLGDHARKGKRFVPPFVHTLGPLQEVKWIDVPLPELLWLALLNHRHGLERGAELALTMARSGMDALASGERRWFAPTSAYGILSANQRSAVISQLAAGGHLIDLQSALDSLVALYPECPLAFLFVGATRQGERAQQVAALKRVLANLFDKTTPEAVSMQANAVYIAFVSGLLRASATTSMANFPAVADYPRTDESQRVAASVRSTINMFFTRSYDRTSQWPGYFWNHGLEIDGCMFATDDDNE